MSNVQKLLILVMFIMNECSYILVKHSEQMLSVFEKRKLIAQYPVSTAKKGLGEQKGSEQTPRGWHIIRAKIGAGLPVNSVFVRRRPTGEIYTDKLGQQFPQRDWILTRILWLSGLEVGKNRLGNVDTMQRYIYIHGYPEDSPVGVPSSHGCIRIRNQDLLKLFANTPIGMKLVIE